MNKDGKILLESKRAATTPDVACQRGQVLQGDGIDFLVAADLGGSLQVHLQITRHNAHKGADFITMDQDCLEYLVDV